MRPATLRRRVALMLVLILVQAGIGMAVNLYVSVPGSHPGANPSNYVTGSLRSIGWAIAHSPASLAIHAVIGIVLVVIALVIAMGAVRSGLRVVAVCCVIGAALVIGAGFNGASFLDFNHDVSSLIMALLAFGAGLMYVAALYLLPAG